jgi:site-specific recombinase XerD
MPAMPRIRISGPLVPHLGGVWSHLLAQGYTPLYSKNLLRLASHLSRWLVDTGVRLRSLRREHLERFFRERRHAGYTCFLTPRSLTPVLQYLEAEGIVSLPEALVARSTVDELLDEYEQFLVKERGLQAATICYYRRYAQKFLSLRFDLTCRGLSSLSANDITTFILHESQTSSVGTTKLLVTVLRSLLRFLHLRGDLQNDLVGAVPAVAGWRQAGLPKFISTREIRQLLNSCDRRSHVGRRDFAILLLLARLGLRSCEVAALELEDIDWRAGELDLHGKGHTDVRLPLPSDVGEAMAGYLQRGRPPSTSRSFFLTSRAPYRRLSGSRVTSIVSDAAARAGLPRIGAHRLRHTAATQMLRHGASLTDIALVLRHRSVDTTAIYAKVDHSTLRELAQSWPGGVA